MCVYVYKDSGPGMAGHASLIISAAEYQRRFHAVFQARELPPDLAHDANAAEIAIHARETADYLKEERFVKLFCNKLLLAIDEEAQTACGTGEMLADMTPRDLLGRLEGLFGRVAQRSSSSRQRNSPSPSPIPTSGSP